ncbi:MAG: efflux RND transporter permease subunit [Myxococcota bacterium]
MYAFFIRRPVFASVVAIVITLAGAATSRTLPIEWYPDLALPQVVVTSVYTGATSETVESTVTSVLEEAINGVEGMRYVESTSSNDGVSTITVTFERSRDLDIASVDVQNRVASVQGRLPPEVRAIGVDVRRATQAIILGIGMYAENDEYDSVFISNYVDRYIRDELRRIKGVGEARIFGERKYAMRIWVDPIRLAANQLSANEIVRALEEQNIQVAAGQIGQPPVPDTTILQVALSVNGRFDSAEEFEKLVLRSDEAGGLVRLEDVGRAELGAESYSSALRFNRREAVGLGIFQLPNSNALEIEQAVKKRLEELSVQFPPGLEYVIAFNPTEIVSESIEEVLYTLVGTILLVILVIFAFLQRWQSTLIPAVTIPVSLVGTFIFVGAFGFSINTLTLFGLTLATGLVVDDAIVVIENIERHAREQGLKKRAAALSGTSEVFGAVIATSLVLIAVFAPVAFFPGTTGVMYQQFALTIAFSIALSSLTALTLAPALAGLLLDVQPPPQRGPFALFNRILDAGTRRFEIVLKAVLRRGKSIAILIFLGLVGLTYGLNTLLPASFVPAEDQGYFITVIQAPPGTSLDETSRIMAKVEDILQADEDVANTFAILGFSFEGTASNRATIFSTFTPREERPGPEHEAKAVVQRVFGPMMMVPDAIVLPFEPPPIRGVGNLGGFTFELQDRAGIGATALDEAAQELIGAAGEQSQIGLVFTTYSSGDPQLHIQLDRERSRSLGVSVDEAFGAIQVMLGSAYVNDFDLAQRSYRVYAQAEPVYRDEPDSLQTLYVRSSSGRMIPLEALVTTEERAAPQIIKHFNLFRSATLTGSPAPGFSSGDSIEAMSGVASDLPLGFDYSWSGLALEEVQSGNQTTILFLFGLILVYLVLSAQYESYVLPVIILTSVPMALLGALGAQWLRGLQNDVFCQVGLLMLIGLASKNAILIVEFAQQERREKGLDPLSAAVSAASIRLRPILMTSFAFILGVLPLVLADGASKFSRQSLGTAVFGGMLLSTLVNMVFVPLFYVLVARFAPPPELDPRES